jgi:hypothetical protein
MKLTPRSLPAFAFWVLTFTICYSPLLASAQSCQLGTEIDEATRTAISTAAQRNFDMAAKGDTASMKEGSVPSLASSFGEIEAAVKYYEPRLTGAQAAVGKIFVLDATGPAPIAQAQFYCGVFGKNGQTANSAAFNFDNLPPAKYAVALVDATSAKGKTMFSEILQQAGTDWKLAGLYVKPAEVAGHDSDWFLARAREYKQKGQVDNAWLYYMQGTDLVSRGMPFMSTQATDNLYDEMHGITPKDIPVPGQTTDLTVGTATYKLTAVYVGEVGNDLDVFVKQHVADASNTAQAYQDNLAVMKGLLAKVPEFRDAFSGVDVIAIDAQGRNYGTLLPMKDIK